MIEFIKENPYLVYLGLSLLILIGSLVFNLIKKRPVVNLVDEIKARVLEVLPLLINSVESPGNGSSKLQAVLSMVHQFIKKQFRVDDFESLDPFIIQSIEEILSTPSKKGDK